MNIIKKPYYLLSVILLFLLSACGSNQQASDTGSISFNLELSRPTTASRAAAATPADICTDYGITTINVNVVTSSGATVAAGNWSCSAHQGTIEDVPAGAGYTIRITGTATGGAIAWRGEKSGVGVTAGETTPAGAITMAYTGNDTTPPVITSTTPLIDATGVPVTTMITALFSEKMAASSINDSTFTLKQGSTSVSGYVVYDAATQRAVFLPSGNLSYASTYTSTLTTGVEDMAGNKMESIYEWRFTTGDPPPPDTLPDAPAGLIAASGNIQITITWDAVPAATSYNIYWSATSGVTKTTGTKISDITTTSYTHTGLTNGTIYYYIVTSTNSYGEGIESNEISSAPGSTDATPPTGAITINNNAVYTTSTDVTLSLSSSSTRGISQMCLSNTTTCSSWEPYTTSKSWTLTTGDGTRFVYAWFKDSSGTSSTSPYLAAIILDTTSPSNTTGSNFINGGAASTSSPNVTLTISATDSVGVTGYYVSESAIAPLASDSGWTSITSTTSYFAGVTFTLSAESGVKTVYVWFKDAAGNVSNVISSSINAIAPSAPTGVTASAGYGQVTISWNGVSGAASYNIYWDSSPGVAKNIGTKLINATSPYTHNGLTNGITYYYVVTAVNSYGESIESSQETATPTISSCVQSPSGLVSWWPGDGDSNDIQDSNHVTLKNGVTFVPGMVGQAFSFDGVNDYIEVPYSSSFNLSNGHTIDLWIKLDAYPQTGKGFLLIGKWVVGAEDKYLIIRDDGKLGYYLYNVVGGVELSSNISLTLGTWYHVAAVYDGTIAQIYINGKLDAFKSASGDVADSTGKLYLGHNPDRIAENDTFFKGEMDEVSWYNSTLSISEINNIFTVGSTGKCKL